MRARNIKPSFFMNEELAECKMESRLLFIGLWCYADKRGKFEWKPKKIKATLFPYDNIDIDYCLNELSEKNMVIHYSVAGSGYGIIPNFELHQRPHPNEVESIIPSPGEAEVEEPERFLGWNTLKEAVFKRDGRICVYCGTTDNLCIDNIVPISNGGNNEISNIHVLCQHCKSKKSGYEKDGLSAEEIKRRTKVESTYNQSYKPGQPKSKALCADIIDTDIIDTDTIEKKATACSEAKKNLASEPTDSRTENQQPDSDNHQQQPNAQAQTQSPTPQQAEEPAIISIPLVCKKSGPHIEFDVTQAMVDDWAESFPAVDVPQKLREIRQWNLANPKKRKTKSGIVHHIVTWLTKEQNSGGNNGGKTASGHFGRQQPNRPAASFVPIVSTGNKNLDISLTNAANFVQRRMAEAEGMVAHEA